MRLSKDKDFINLIMQIGYIVDIGNINEQIHRTCTLPQSHGMTLLLALIGVDLRASGVIAISKILLYRTSLESNKEIVD